MKTNSYTRILIFIPCFVVILSCNNEKKNDIISKPIDVSIKKPVQIKLEENNNEKKSVLLDTTLNGFFIKIEKISSTSNESKVKEKNIIIDDNQFNLLIRSKDEIILNKLFKKNFFSNIIPHEEMKFYHFSVFIFDRIDKDSLIFFINICKPDTDICYPIQMTVNKKGKIETLELDDEFEE